MGGWFGGLNLEEHVYGRGTCRWSKLMSTYLMAHIPHTSKLMPKHLEQATHLRLVVDVMLNVL